MVAEYIHKIFCLSGFNRGVAMVTGFAWGYSFCNPDNDFVYESFPHYRKTPFAFLGCYKVKTKDEEDGTFHPSEKNNDVMSLPLDTRNISPKMEYEFCERWKKLARYFQTQPGYLFTRLNKAVVDEGLFGDVSFVVCTRLNKAVVDEGLFGDYTPQFHYVDTMHWTTKDYFQYACERAEGRRLIQELEECMSKDRGYDPYMYGIVADDRDTRFARMES